MHTTGEAKVVEAGTGWSHTWGLDTTVVKLRADETAGWFTLVEDTPQPGWSLAAHRHEFHAELFYVLEGSIRFVISGDTVDATPNTTVYIPPSIVHEASTESGGRMLMFYAPGGFDRLLALWAAGDDAPPIEQIAFDIVQDASVP